MSDAAPFPAELLAANARFVRAVARAVVHGDADADDAAQDAMAAAIERGPREPGALRAWLFVVARNLARRLVRGESRRRSRERAAARPDRVDAVHEIAEREEARRRLVAAVLALEEPSRTAVLLRHYDGLSVREVASRLGVPLETARARLRRGLARLRSDLAPESPGRRSALFAAVVGLGSDSSGGCTRHSEDSQ